MELREVRLAVIGLGYVGLPLAVAFSKKYPVIGFDVNQNRINQLVECHDTTREVSRQDLSEALASHLTFSCKKGDLASANVYIVTVPTPIDRHKRPNLAPLIKASEMLGGVVTEGNVIIYESTVYPGATEDDCVPVVERVSGLKCNKDFFAGYSPERINPGDKEHRITNILKVTSGSTPETADFVDMLYGSIIEAGTHRAPSIRVAEAAKVIENTQRDVNIALINELSIVFNRLEIDTLEVLEAAGTKWNFLPFRPGLVGGHCIGVDPYYLTHKALSVGYHPEIVLAGRRLNDQMGQFVASQLIKKMIKERINVASAQVLVMGLTFKENCPDLRNSKVIDIIEALDGYGVKVDVTDPCCSANEAIAAHNIELTAEPKEGAYDAIVIAVGHDQFRAQGPKKIRALGKPACVVYDLKYIVSKGDSDLRL